MTDEAPAGERTYPAIGAEYFVVYEIATGRAVGVGFATADEIAAQAYNETLAVLVPHDGWRPPAPLQVDRIRVTADRRVYEAPLETFVVYDRASARVLQHGQIVAEDVHLMALDDRLVAVVMPDGFVFPPNTRAQDIRVNLETGEIDHG